jgi:filamentous hemagglutinin family protein
VRGWRRSRAHRDQGDSARLRPSRNALAYAVSAAFAAGASPALANPSGASVTYGGVTFSVNGNTLTITNTPGAIINWQQFSIARDEITRFIQQHAASTVLNRVVGQNPSLILGQIVSNGRVFLINPNGIAFGKGAVIDVAGFAASSLNISDADFTSGRMRFEGTGAEGKVSNAGTIRTAEGGHVYLIAPNVENEKGGVITSPKGEVVIAAGKTVELVNSRTPDLRVEFVAPNNQAVNAGEIVAASGSVGIYGTLIKNSGLVSASRAEVGDGGKIVFRATRQVTLEGDSRVESTGTQGGEIQILGQHVGLVDNALVDASGDLGGGTVLIGGDFQGKNPDVPNAEKTYVGGNVVIRANAIEEGDGGKVIVWADDWTKFFGSIEAKGGARGGNGGFAEVSGYNSLTFDGKVDLSAPRGIGGTLLLDPNNIIIADGGQATLGDAGDNAPADNTLDFSEGGGTTADQTIDADAITAITNTGTSVELQAHTDITVNEAIVSTGTGGLTLRAGDDISVNQAITLADGSLSLIAGSAGATPTGGNADPGANITIGAAIGTGSGTVTMSATDTIAIDAAVTNSSSVSLTSTAGAISQSAATGSISTASLTTSSAGGTVLNGANTVASFSATNTPNGTVELTNTATTLTVAGITQGDAGLTIANTGNLNTTGAVTTASGGSIALTATGGSLTTGAAVTAGGIGTITLTATGTNSDVQMNANVGSGSGLITVTAARDVIIGNNATLSTGGGVSLTATAGSILETGGTAGKVVASLLTTVSALGQNLVGANQVGVFNATNTGSGNVTLVNASTTLNVSGANTGGNFVVEQTGALSTSGDISGVNVELTGSTGINLGHAVTATGTLDLTASSGGIGQSAGAITATPARATSRCWPPPTTSSRPSIFRAPTPISSTRTGSRWARST